MVGHGTPSDANGQHFPRQLPYRRVRAWQDFVKERDERRQRQGLVKPA